MVGALGARQKRGWALSLKSCIKLLSVAIKSDLGVLLSIDFNSVGLLCYNFLVVEDLLSGRLSMI